MTNLRRAFTLIELLVVIAIIGILASMIFPSFARAREMARRTSCASNLRQLGLAVQQYTQDYDERLPGAYVGSTGAGKSGGWIFYSVLGTGSTPTTFNAAQGALFSYTKSAQILVCPSDSVGQQSGNSYALNSCAMTPTDAAGYSAGKSEAAFEETSKWMLWSEEGSPDSKASTDDGYQRLAENFFTARHLSGSNLAFMDGHVKFYPVSRIEFNHFQSGGVDTGATCP